jgi:hypothetical protein
MKSTVMQYVTLTVMMLLLVAAVSMFPERNSRNSSSIEVKKTAANSISVVESAPN